MQEFETHPRWHVRIKNLNRSFGKNKILHNVTLDLERGKINALIGASGSGKSVLVKHLIGLLKPDSGTIIVDGIDIHSLDQKELTAFRKNFGMVFQFSALFDSLTVRENCEFPLREHTTKSNEEMRTIVSSCLALLGVDGTEDKYPDALSGGMRKRVALARALMLEPKIIIYDEPTTGLDPLATKNVDDMISAVSKDRDVTSIVVSHDMASVSRVADRVAMLHQGSILVAASIDEIKQSKDEYVQRFINTSGVVI